MKSNLTNSQFPHNSIEASSGEKNDLACRQTFHQNHFGSKRMCGENANVGFYFVCCCNCGATANKIYKDLYELFEPKYIPIEKDK